jgi:hypothetical protein
VNAKLDQGETKKGVDDSSIQFSSNDDRSKRRKRRHSESDEDENEREQFEIWEDPTPGDDKKTLEPLDKKQLRAQKRAAKQAE